MNTEHRAFIEHFQLRNLVAATSRSDIYYAGSSKVMHTSSSGHGSAPVMDFTGANTDASRFVVTTLDAKDDVLIAGGFYGDYAVLNLNSRFGTSPTHGFVSDLASGHTNHTHLFSNRHSGRPQAAFASNDGHLRVLDVCSNQMIHDVGYSYALNCCATSPNGRMRVVCGDSKEVLITDAETGHPLVPLRPHDTLKPDHTADSFACAWADDDIHVATGAQDSTVAIFDARNWSRPLAKIATEVRHPRSLRFSPVGGGKRVLVAVESDDFVNVIDAESFQSKQVLDFFGTVAGVSFTPDGSSLFVMNSDATFGGLMEYERTGYGAAYAQAGPSRRTRAGHMGFGPNLEDDPPSEWSPQYALDSDPRVILSAKARSRRGLDLGDLLV